jgi:hypothetical protein
VAEKMLEERGLADARFAAEHDHTAGSGSRIRDEPIQGIAFSAPVLEARAQIARKPQAV